MEHPDATTINLWLSNEGFASSKWRQEPLGRVQRESKATHEGKMSSSLSIGAPKLGYLNLFWCLHHPTLLLMFPLPGADGKGLCAALAGAGGERAIDLKYSTKKLDL